MTLPRLRQFTADFIAEEKDLPGSRHNVEVTGDYIILRMAFRQGEKIMRVQRYIDYAQLQHSVENLFLPHAETFRREARVLLSKE